MPRALFSLFFVSGSPARAKRRRTSRLLTGGVKETTLRRRSPKASRRRRSFGRAHRATRTGFSVFFFFFFFSAFVSPLTRASMITIHICRSVVVVRHYERKALFRSRLKRRGVSVCLRARRTRITTTTRKKKRKKKSDIQVLDPETHLDLAQPRLAAGTLVRRGDLRPVRELLVRPPFPAPRGDLFVVFFRGVALVQERASRHRARVACRNERRWLAFADCEETRPLTFADALRRLRFRDPIPSPLRAKCRPRLDPGVSAGDSCGARRRRRLVARASVVSSVASGARNASPGGIRQSARGEFAREVRFMAYVLRSRRNANPTEGYRLVRDLWRNRPTRVSAVFRFFFRQTRLVSAHACVQKSSAPPAAFFA